MKQKKEVTLFLDSGAHSLYMKLMLQNNTFNEKEYDKYFKNYIEFIKENEEVIDVYVNLDVINDPVRSMKNYKYMVKQGLKPIGVVHPGEDHKWIDQYIDMGCEYIGLGGLGQFFTKQKYYQWADPAWSDHICDRDGMPKVKVHGFAMTSLDLMWRYPWWSVDSTSWVQTGRFGGVYVPKFRRGQYVYNENSLKVTISNQSPSQKDDGQHFTTFSPMEQKQILKYFDEKGFAVGRSEYRKEDRKKYKLKDGERWVNSIDAEACRDLIENLGKYVPPDKLAMKDLVEIIIEPGLSNDYRLRDELNIIYFLDLERSLPKWPWPFKVKSNKGFDL
jgi:hypothetical protein